MKKARDFKRGKRGQVRKTPGKTRITIYLDDDVLDAFRERSGAAGRGYQTMINEALRATLGDHARPVDVETLRRVIREELPQYRTGPGARKRRKTT
jgi:hypothetical protein